MVMKRKASVGSVTEAIKKLKVSRKGANAIRRLKLKGGKPSYGTSRNLNFSASARDKALLGFILKRKK